MIVTAIAVVSTLFHLYAAYAIVPTQTLRYVHVAFVMALCFLLFPLATRFRNAIRWWDVVAAIASVGILGYALIGGEEFTDRATMPDHLDVVLGVVFIVLLLEATRRTTGWIMPVVAIAFMLYAFFGNHLPAPWTHRGYDEERLIPHLAITLEGIFGTALDVSATLIILFTIYGAFLQQSGAGKFFIDFSFAATGGRPMPEKFRAMPTRQAAISGFLSTGSTSRQPAPLPPPVQCSRASTQSRLTSGTTMATQMAVNVTPWAP